MYKTLYRCRLIEILQSDSYRSLSRDSNFNSLLNLVSKFEANKHKDGPKHHENFIRIIGNGNSGSPKSFLLFADRRSYLFNCGESTSRILKEMNVIKDLDDVEVLLTRSTWTECFSGIFGLIYTLTSLGKYSFIRFHSPFDMPKFLFDTYHLLKLKSTRFERHDYANKGAFHSNSVKIECLKFNSVHGYYLILNSHKTTMSRILVIDIPTHRILNEFINSQISMKIDLFVHLSPNEILFDEKYVNYVRHISNKSTKHLVFDENEFNLASKQIYLQQTFLNELNQFIFPMLPFEKPKSK